MNFSFNRVSFKDLTTLSSIFNSAISGYSNYYRTSPEMIKKKIFISKDFFENGSFIFYNSGKPIGFILSKFCFNSLPDYKDTAHISLFAVKSDYQRKGVGSMLYTKLEESAKKHGIKKIIVGQDLDNIFSGIPFMADNPYITDSIRLDERNDLPQTQSSAIDFLKNLGFTVSSDKNFDLLNDLSHYQFNTDNLHICTSDDYRTVQAEISDIPSLKTFMQKEFPGRWDFEVSGTFGSTELNHILLLKNKDSIKGFCRIRFDFDTNFNEFYLGSSCGALGPVGIAEDSRGLGLGNRLLYDSLMYLKKIGAKNTNIDWTGLLEFYSQFGFKPWRSFFSAEKAL